MIFFEKMSDSWFYFKRIIIFSEELDFLDGVCQVLFYYFSRFIIDLDLM